MFCLTTHLVLSTLVALSYYLSVTQRPQLVEVSFCYPGLQALLLHRLAHGFIVLLFPSSLA